MPNWCYTHMEVKGEAEELKKFLDGIAKTDDGYYDILNTYYPCPQALRDTVAGWTTDPEKQEKLVAQQAENIANYGHTDWYDWQIENWGTKWGDCHTELDCYTETEADFRFESAWSPITAGITEVSKQFPNLYFILEHDEEAGFFMGVEVVKNGSVLCEDFCQPDKEYDGSSTDDEDFNDSFSEWKNDRLDKCHESIRKSLSKLGIEL